MKKRKTWQSKLTKTELKHLKETVFQIGERPNIETLKRNFEAQAEMRKEELEPCRTCRAIAHKLGFAV